MIDSAAMRILTRFVDMMCLNILWFLCSIPLVTIGASTTALYTVMLKFVRDEEGYIAKSFFKAFKDNLRQSTVVWLLLAAAGFIITVDAGLSRYLPGNLSSILWVVFIVLGVLVYCISLYAFPLLARYQNSIRGTLKNAWILTLAKLPYTLLMLLSTALFLVSTIAALLTAVSTLIAMLVWLLIGVSLTAWINSSILVKIFASLEEQEDNIQDALQNGEG